MKERRSEEERRKSPHCNHVRRRTSRIISGRPFPSHNFYQTERQINIRSLSSWRSTEFYLWLFIVYQQKRILERENEHLFLDVWEVAADWHASSGTQSRTTTTALEAQWGTGTTSHVEEALWRVWRGGTEWRNLLSSPLPRSSHSSYLRIPFMWQDSGDLYGNTE